MTPPPDFFLPPRPSTPPPPPPPARPDPLQVCNPPAAGIDIGAAEPGVAVPPARAPHPLRRCGPCTAALAVVADWRIACGITTVAMASTGVSWMPLCALLDARGVQGLLLDPRQAKRAPGRPTTDRRDGQGRPRWQTSGLRAGALRPEAPVGGLRTSVRHRQRLRTSAAHPMQPMPQAVQQRQRTLTQVVRDLTGATGLAILTARIAGARHPVTLATLRNAHGQHAADDLAKALQGPWHAAPLCA